MLWGIWIVSVGYCWYITRQFWDKTAIPFLIGGMGMVAIDDAIVGRATNIYLKIIPPISEDSSEQNRLKRFIALCIGVVLYVGSMFVH